MKKTNNKEIYVSTDIETDGPSPGDYSMISIGSAAFSTDGIMQDTFSRNIEPLPNAKQDKDTMLWWQTQPEAYKMATRDPVNPHLVMNDYATWLEQLPGHPVFVGYPAGFDFTFVYWYLHYFAKRSPFGFSAIDIKSYAMALLKTPFRETVKSNMPKDWFNKDTEHTHIAIDDAIEQGNLFCSMMRFNKVGVGP